MLANPVRLISTGDARVHASGDASEPLSAQVPLVYKLYTYDLHTRLRRIDAAEGATLPCTLLAGAAG